MADTDRNWRILGERDPYFGVLTDPRIFTQQTPEAKRA